MKGTELKLIPTKDHGQLLNLLLDHHTQYVLRSILTADGDIFIRSGGVIARLAKDSDGKILELAAGLPTWQTKPTSLTFTELAGGEDHNPTNFDVWEDWDLSAIIPAGAVAALIECLLWQSTGYPLGVRQNGSALVRLSGLNVQNGVAVILTQVDANRIIEIFVTGTVTRGRFSVLGYWS